MPDLIARIEEVTASGRICWVVGENGAGKSALLRMLSGAHDVGYIAPPVRFPPNISLYAWQRFNAVIDCDPQIEPLVQALCPRVSLTCHLDELSTGESKRFLLWSLLRARKRAFVLDEPFEHLSPTAKSNLCNIVIELARRAKVIIATNQDIPELDPSIVELA